MKKATDILRELSLKHSELKTKMEEIGAATDLEHIEAERIGKFIGALATKAYNQLSHDIYTNVPTGIMSRDEVSGHALKSAIASALGELNHWDIYATLEMCAEILEDVNAHPEAKMLRDLVTKYQQ